MQKIRATFSRPIIAAALFFFFFSMLVTFPLFLKINTGIYGPLFGTDIRGTIWFSWWYKYAYEHHLNLYSCPFLSAPFGVDFSAAPFFSIPLGLIKYLTILTNPIAALNLLAIFFLAASGIIIFRIVRAATSNFSAALISGFIFAFSPYHLNKLMEFSFVYIGGFAALFILALLGLKKNISLKTSLAVAVAFSLLLAFSTYYAYFAGFFTLGFLIYCCFFQWKIKLKEVRERHLEIAILRIKKGLKFLLASAAAFLLALLINGPTILKILRNLSVAHVDKEAIASVGYFRSFDYLFAQSARPLSYLLPASTHPIFGNFTKKMFGSFLYGRGSVEQTLYLGWIPLVLALGAFLTWKQRRRTLQTSRVYIDTEENFLIGFFLFSALLMFFFSLPPFLDLAVMKIYFPSFFLHKLFPMFRAYARCGLFVILCVSILAGFGAKFILEKIKSKALRNVLTFFLLSGIAFEFTNVPPWRVTDTTASIPEIYQWLSRQKGDFIIAEYPMPTAVAGEASENYDYMFYQTIHEKKMVNGASPGTKYFGIRQKISKLDHPQTAGILKALGVKYILVHLDLYRSGEYKEATDIVGDVPHLEDAAGYRFVAAFGQDLVYQVMAPATDISEFFSPQQTP